MAYTYEQLLKMGATSGPVSSSVPEKKSYTYDELIKLGAKPEQNIVKQTPLQKAIAPGQEVNTVKAFQESPGGKVLSAITTSERAFGKTLGDALAYNLYGTEIDENNKRLLNSGTTLIDLAMKTKDPIRRDNLIKQAKQAFEMSGNSWEEILPSIQKSTKQILGEAGGVALDVLLAGTYSKVAQTGKMFKATPEIISTASQIPKTFSQGLKKGVIQTGKTMLEGGAAGYGFDITQGLQAGESNKEAFTPGLGTALGSLAPLAFPLVKGGVSLIKGAKGVLNPSLEESILKSIKPSFGSKTVTQTDRYMNDAATAIETINERKPTLIGADGIEVVRNPETRAELATAIDQTKKSIFTEYDALAKAAGEQGAKFNAEPIVAQLTDVTTNLKYPPAVRDYAKAMIQEIKELQGASPEIIQERIKDLNSSLGSFFNGRTSKASAQVDASIAAAMREQQDKMINELTGANYQALKKKYGALSTIEKDVARQVNNELRKNQVGLADFTDIFTGGDIMKGIVTLDPAALVKGLTGKALKEFYQYLNSGDRYIKEMFKQAEKNASKIPKGSGATSPKTVNGILTVPTDYLKSLKRQGGHRTKEQIEQLRKEIIKDGINRPIEIIKNEEGRISINNGLHRLDITEELGKNAPIEVFIEKNNKIIKLSPIDALKVIENLNKK